MRRLRITRQRGKHPWHVGVSANHYESSFTVHAWHRRWLVWLEPTETAGEDSS